jgi:predicted transcriptional regulator
LRGKINVTLEEIKNELEGEVVVGHEKLPIELKTAFAADLMSDVLAYARSGCLLITGLTTAQSVRTAFALDIAAIIICRGKMPQEQAIEIAKELHIPIIRTHYIMFETCGILYRAGIYGCIREVCSGDNACGI